MSHGQNSEASEGFIQTAATLGNQYETDFALKNLLRTYLPKEILSQAKSDFVELGEDAAGKLLAWARDAEANEPVLTKYNPWGERIDHIQMCDSWKKIEAYAATHGVVASGYERKFAEWSRVYQMVLLYLFNPSSAFVSCPLAMTDGAAKLIETFGDAKLKQGAFRHLTSREPKEFWTSGQWMTERIGGSDVSRTETIARSKGDSYALYGTKFFTSATTSPMAMTLARIEGSPAAGERNASVPSAGGSKGLSLFYLETGISEGKLNQIEILRLKDKLGSRAMPTAELRLNGSSAHLIGGIGDGVKKIATLFNITRIYNSVCAVSAMRRSIAWAEDYSKKREAFGKKVYDHALFRESFADAVVEFEGCLHLIFRLAHLLGKEEAGLASESDRALLRLLTPVAKLYTGKSAVAVVSEMVEVFGGVGYCEDSGIPGQLRDAQVLPIWEGTTNVLSLDVLRALKKECPLEVVLEDMQRNAAKVDAVKIKIQELSQFATKLLKEEDPSVSAREFSLQLGRTYIASLLADAAAKDASSRSNTRLQRWLLLSRTYHYVDSAQVRQTQEICDSF